MLRSKLKTALTVAMVVTIPILAGVGARRQLLKKNADSQLPLQLARQRRPNSPRSPGVARKTPAPQEPAKTGEEEKAAREAERRVCAVTPKGWTVTVNGATLTVRRDEPVRLVSRINAPPLPKDREEKKADIRARSFESRYTLVLRFQPLLSEEQWRQLRRENVRASEKATQLQRKVNTIPHKLDDYHPHNAEQERHLREYQVALQELAFHELPNFHDDHSSMTLTTSLSWGFDFAEEEVRRECEQTRKRVEALFRPYEDAKDALP